MTPPRQLHQTRQHELRGRVGEGGLCLRCGKKAARGADGEGLLTWSSLGL